MSSSIENIEKVLGAKRFGDRSAQIDWILTDSRSLCFPEETLFFALKTKRNDGHKYLPELYERGVRNFVVGELPADMKSFQDANFLQLANPLKGLQKLAEKHREQFQIPVIGITGSNGKTIVKEWLYQLLSPDRVVTRSPRSYNSQIGVPLSVWLMNERTELAIFEAGISEMGEMEALQTIIKPTVGILTNIGGAHQENFFSLQDKCMEKLTLFKDCDVIIYDGDNELISSCVAKSLFTSREIAWSKKDNERPLFIESIQKGEHVTTIKYRYLGMPNEFSIPFIDDASIENSLHCLAVALYMMVSPEQITERMARLEQIAMRLEVKEGKNGCVLINDSYNSDLASLDIALDFMSRRSDDKGKKRTLILSDMLETGQSSKLLYRQVAELVHSRGVEKIIGVGEEIRTAAARFEIEKYFFRTTEELLESDLLAGLRNEVILVMISYAADSHSLYGEMYRWPAATWPKGAMLEVKEWDTGKPLGKIAQVEKTYSVVGNMNEHQVAITESTFGGRHELVDTTGIMDYGSLIYIALQRSKSAREAIKVMTDLVKEYGYYSSGET